jgi:3-oxoacyl-[acyl-carrier-protein] synthase III
MFVAAIEHAVPSRRLTNDDVLTMVAAANGHLPRAELRALRDDIERLWAVTGTAVRRVRAEGERAIDFCVDAARRAMDDAGVHPDDVDLVLYTGVARGWIEPAMANVVIHELGLRRATGFDVLDACASWLRAMQLAQAYLDAGTYRTALVVNCEFSTREFANLHFERAADLEHLFAALTIGEAATATVLRARADDGEATRDDAGDDTGDDAGDDTLGEPHAEARAGARGRWDFAFRNFSDGYDLCMIPLPGADQFRTAPARVRARPLTFYSRSRELIGSTSRRVVETFRADPRLAGRCYDVAFGHAASDAASLLVCRQIGIPVERLCLTHAEYGNTVSASVPLAMSLARRDGRLRRGMRVLVVVGSAGISVGLAGFVF